MVNIADAWDTAKNANVAKSSNNDLQIPLTRPNFQSLPSNATNSADFVIKGYSQAGTTVYLKINTRESGSVVTDSSGTFTFGNIVLNEGDNRFVAYAKDASGRKSDETEPFILNLDTRAPTLEITSPNSGETLGGAEKKVLEVQGKTSEATQMYVNDSWVIMNPDGTFNYKVQLQPGENTLTMFAKDDAGNKSVDVVRKVTYNP